MSRFVDALLSADRPVIAEVKPRTGTGVDLAGGRSAGELVAAFHAGGVACVSVVTGRWFGGDVALLDQVAELTDLPILRKDFLTRDSHLVDSRRRGASAVLLTAGLLPAPALARLVWRALELGMTPFVEVTSEAEIAAVPAGPDVVIAVNNKDIRVRETNATVLARSRRLLPALADTGIRCPVSASGLDLPADAAAMLATGYRGLLVGTGLLRAVSPLAWLAEFDRCRTELAARTGGPT
jgi:indole-3-glycerol phosphate synthase